MRRGGERWRQLTQTVEQGLVSENPQREARKTHLFENRRQEEVLGRVGLEEDLLG